MQIISSEIVSPIHDWGLNFINSALYTLPNVLIAIFIFSVFLFISSYSRKIISRLTYIKNKNLVIIISRLAQWCGILTGLFFSMIIIIPSFKFGDFISALGIGSVALGFAFKDILQNFLSGILILITEPFTINDEIVVNKGNFEGKVTHINTRSTYLQTYDGRRVVIPNADLFTGTVTVNTAYQNRRNSYIITLSVDSNVEDIKDKILKTLLTTEGVDTSPVPKIEAIKLDKTSIQYQIYWWSQSSLNNQIDVKNRIIENLLDDVQAIPDEMMA